MNILLHDITQTHKCWEQTKVYNGSKGACLVGNLEEYS